MREVPPILENLPGLAVISELAEVRGITPTWDTVLVAICTDALIVGRAWEDPGLGTLEPIDVVADPATVLTKCFSTFYNSHEF